MKLVLFAVLQPSNLCVPLVDHGFRCALREVDIVGILVLVAARHMKLPGSKVKVYWRCG